MVKCVGVRSTLCPEDVGGESAVPGGVDEKPQKNIAVGDGL